MKSTIEYSDKYKGFMVTWTKNINGKEYEYSYVFSGDIKKEEFFNRKKEAERAFEKKM